MDPEVAPMMSLPSYTSIVAGLPRARTTDLDWYARAEFGDRESAWLVNGLRSNHSASASSEPENDGRLRRFTQAITTFLF